MPCLKTFLAVFLLAFTFCLSRGFVYGQSHSGTPLLKQEAAAIPESFLVQQDEPLSGIKEPIMIKLKRGHSFKANLIGAEANMIILEVKRRIFKIDLDLVESIIQEARRFDEFGDLGNDDEKARLDNFAIALQQEPDMIGYIIVFGQKGGRAGEAKRHADYDKGYLIDVRSIDKTRLISLDHCSRLEFTVQLWLVPKNATAPVPCSESKPRAKRK